MDMKTGIIYNSLDEARAAGVEEVNLLKVRQTLGDQLDQLEHVKPKYPKNPFQSLKNTRETV